MSGSLRSRSAAPLAVRAHPLVLGTVLFLASESMFFAALFAAYFDLRANHAAWPPRGVPSHLLSSGIGTATLAIASLAMILATRAMDRGRWTAARLWTASAILSALAFVVIALEGYASDPFTIATSAYGSIYYTMTGFHLLHVLAGIAILTAMLIGMRSPALRADRRAGAEAMMYYWHFVFIVWIGIWTVVDVVR